MDRWDEREAGKDQKLGSKRTILVLIGLMVGMWVILGIITYAGAPDNCAMLETFIKSDDYYDMSSDERQRFMDAYQDCERKSIVVK